MRRVLIALLIGTVAVPAARADGTGEISYRVPGTRPARDRIVIASLVGAGVVAGGVAVWFHLDSRDAAAEVSADDGTPVGTWTEDRQALHDRAGASGTAAIVGYSLSATLLVGAAVYAYVTRPPDEVIVLRPATSATPVVAPVPGGAVVGGEWRW